MAMKKKGMRGYKTSHTKAAKSRKPGKGVKARKPPEGAKSRKPGRGVEARKPYDYR